MSFKCVIFDFDGTLADSKECSVRSTQQAFSMMGFSIPSYQLIEHYMGIPIEQSFLDMSEETLDDNTLAELITTFRDFYKNNERSTLQVFPYFPGVLDALHGKEIKCFVLSSKKTDVLDRNLKQLNIRDYFEEIYGSDRVKEYKPHPYGILQILEKYNFEKNTAVMIGDATFDIEMGKSAEITTVAVTWGSHNLKELEKSSPTFIADSPSQLKEMLT